LCPRTIAPPPGVKKHENCADRAAHGERAAAALWRDRANCLFLRMNWSEVTLFASADSISAAELVSCASMALRLDGSVRDPTPNYMLMLDRVRKLAEEFDILHFHIDQFHFPLFRQMADRTGTTLHGRLDLPDLKALYLGFSDMPLAYPANRPRCAKRLAKPSPSWPTSRSRPAARQNKPRRRSRQRPIKRQKAFVARPHLAN
jgi:hypothetical protein